MYMTSAWICCFVPAMCGPLLNPPTDNLIQSWEVRLEPLARDIEESLKNPIRFSSNEPRYWKFQRYLTIASRWPKPEFKAPLRSILWGSDTVPIRLAASGLLMYRDPALEREIRAMVDDDRIVATGGCIVHQVGFDIRESVKGFESQESRTIPDLLRDLRFGHESTQLNAFIELKSLGIVLDTAPLLNRWSKATEQMRIRMLDSGKVMIGNENWRIALESIAADLDLIEMSPDVVKALLRNLSDVRSKQARLCSLKVLAKLDSFDSEAKDFDGVVSWAFYALALTAKETDLRSALEWSQSKSDLKRNGGLCVLAGIDLPEAQNVVTQALLNTDVFDILHYPNPTFVLSERDWSNPQNKWHYLRVISRRLDKLLDDNKEGILGNCFWAIRCINTLEGMTGIGNGRSGFLNPGGFDADTARATAKAWSQWIEANDPSKSTTSKPNQ